MRNLVLLTAVAILTALSTSAAIRSLTPALVTKAALQNSSNSIEELYPVFPSRSSTHNHY
jgi:hypothetical protein